MDKKFVIFIDWSGTLCCDKFWSRLRECDEMKIAHEKIFGDGRTLHDDWMRGQYSSEEINRLVAEWTGLPYDLLWQDFTATCRTMSLDNTLREVIYKLRSSAYVVLATGNMDCFTRFTVPALKLEEVFDKIVVSSDLGYLKTEKEGESFLAALREFGVPIKESFLIDDSLNTCDFFASLGGRAIHISGTETTALALENLRQFVRIKQ